MKLWLAKDTYLNIHGNTLRTRGGLQLGFAGLSQDHRLKVESENYSLYEKVHSFTQTSGLGCKHKTGSYVSLRADIVTNSEGFSHNVLMI